MKSINQKVIRFKIREFEKGLIQEFSQSQLTFLKSYTLTEKLSDLPDTLIMLILKKLFNNSVSSKRISSLEINYTHRQTRIKCPIIRFRRIHDYINAEFINPLSDIGEDEKKKSVELAITKNNIRDFLYSINPTLRLYNESNEAGKVAQVKQIIDFLYNNIGTILNVFRKTIHQIFKEEIKKAKKFYKIEFKFFSVVVGSIPPNENSINFSMLIELDPMLLHLMNSVNK